VNFIPKFRCTRSSQSCETNILLKIMGLYPWQAPQEESNCAISGQIVTEADRWRGSIRKILRESFEEFEAVAPGVLGVEPVDSWDGGVVRNLYTASEERLPEVVEVGDCESGMGLARGEKILFDADVELLGAAREPAPAAGLERGGLWNFAQAEAIAIEIASGGFAACGSGDLEMVETCDLKFHIQERIPARGRFRSWHVNQPAAERAGPKISSKLLSNCENRARTGSWNSELNLQVRILQLSQRPFSILVSLTQAR